MNDGWGNLDADKGQTLESPSGYVSGRAFLRLGSRVEAGQWLDYRYYESCACKALSSNHR